MIDGGKYGAGKTTDYYMGLRNVDMLLKGDGNIGIEKGSVNISLRNMLLSWLQKLPRVICRYNV